MAISPFGPSLDGQFEVAKINNVYLTFPADVFALGRNRTEIREFKKSNSTMTSIFQRGVLTLVVLLCFLPLVSASIVSDAVHYSDISFVLYE